MLRAKWIRNAPDGNGTLFRGDMYQVPMNGLLGGTTGHRIWEVKTVAQYTPGTRLVLEDGRVFRYAKASNVITRTQFGVKFWALSSDGIETTLSQAQAVGDTTITITAASGVAKDELVGGYVIIHITAGQFRGIIGNTVAAAGSDTIITLASPLSAAVANATYTEIYPNPYATVYSGYGEIDRYSSVAGMPYAITTVANTYLWIQTWGPYFVNPFETIGSAPDTDVRIAVFDYEGAIAYNHEAKGFSGASVSHHQVAGFVINRQESGVSGPPLIMLQISP